MEQENDLINGNYETYRETDEMNVEESDDDGTVLLNCSAIANK